MSPKHRVLATLKKVDLLAVGRALGLVVAEFLEVVG